MRPRFAWLALLLGACSASGAARSTAPARGTAAVVEVPEVAGRDGGAERRPEEGLRLVYEVSPATEEAAEEALGRARERLDAVVPPLPLAVYREGLAVVVELGPCGEEQVRAVKAAMVARGGLAIAGLADGDDPLAALRRLPAPEDVEVDTESVSVGPGATAVVIYAHIARGARPAQAAQRLLAWVRASVPGVERLVLGRATVGGRERLRTFVLAEEPRPLEVSEAQVIHDGHQPAVEVALTAAGAAVFARKSGEHVDRRLAVLLDGEVQLAAHVLEPIAGGTLRITLGSTADLAREAAELATELRLGAQGPVLELAREETFGE